jgi:hypothetical protein
VQSKRQFGQKLWSLSDPPMEQLRGKQLMFSPQVTIDELFNRFNELTQLTPTRGDGNRKKYPEKGQNCFFILSFYTFKKIKNFVDKHKF